MNNSYNKYRLPKAAYGDYLSKSTENKDATWAAKIRAGLGPEYANYNDEQIRRLYSSKGIMTKFGEDGYVAPELDEFTVTSETDKERRDAYSANAAKYFREHPNDAMNDFLQTVGDYTINPIIDGVNYIAENPRGTFQSTTGTLGSDVNSIRGLSRAMGSILRDEEINQEDKDILTSWSHRADEDKTGLASVKDIWGDEAYSNMEGINHLINVLPAAGGVKPVSKLAANLSRKGLKGAKNVLKNGKYYKVNPFAKTKKHFNDPDTFYRQLDELTHASDAKNKLVKGMPESVIPEQKVGAFDLSKSFGDDAYFNKGSLYYGNPNLKDPRPAKFLYESKLPEDRFVGKLNNKPKSKSKTNVRVQKGDLGYDEIDNIYEFDNVWGYRKVKPSSTKVKGAGALGAASQKAYGGYLSTNNNKLNKSNMLKKGNYGMNIPQSTQGQYPAPPVGALNNPAYAQAYTKYMTDNPTTVGQPNQFAPRSEFMYNYGGPTVPYTKETSTAFSGNRGQGPLQAGFNNATPGEYPAISFARNRSTQNVDPRQWANLVVGDLNKPMGVTDTIESMSKNTGATSKRVPMDIYFKNGGKLPKALEGMNLSGITDFLGSEQGGQLMNTVGQLAPIVQGMINKPQQGQRPMQTPQQGMMNPYGMPYTNNPYLPQPQKHQAPTYGGFTYGGLNGKEAEALGMPNYGRQFAYGGMLPKHGFGDFLTSAADAATETMGSGMKIMDPLNIGYGTALSRGMGNLVGEDRYQKGWDQFTDGTQAFVGGAAKGAAGVLPGQMGSLATKGMDAVSGIADNALNNNEYGQLYEGQDKLKQIAGGAGQIGGAVGGGILTGNVAGAVGSGMQGAGNVMQGIDMNNAGEQTGGGWQTAGNITNAASGLASFLPTGAYGGKLPSYGFGNQIGLPGYMGDKDREITINAMNRATPIQSMYNQTPQYQHGMGQSMKGFGPGNQMAYGEMFAKGGVLPSYHNGGEGPGHPHDTGTVYSMMNNSEKLKRKPSYWGSRGSFSNNAEGITTMQNDLQEMNISREDYLALEQAKKDLEIEQATLRDYYGQQNYSQTEGIPVDKVNELSPTYYDKMTAYQNMLKNSAGIENTNLAGNIEGNQIPYHDQAFGFRHNSYRPGLHAAENYTQSNANVEEYADINVDKGQQVYTMDGREKVYDNQNQLLRNEEIPTNRGLKSEAMMFYGNTGPIGVHMDEQGRKYLQGEDGSNLGYFGEDFARGGYTNRYTNRYANGGAMQGQHPQAQYEVEKDEMMYHPNDKPVSLANGGLNQVANNYSKVTGNKHSHPNGGPQMAGGEGGYVYSDQLKVPKDLYNSLKGLI